MKEKIISYFNAPITNKVPEGVFGLWQVHRFIVCNHKLKDRTERVRSVKQNAALYRSLKTKLLPFVTPAGIFNTRCERDMLQPSGMFVVDIDHLRPDGEAARVRDLLFDDPVLRPELAFVSPGGDGVKLFVSYRLGKDDTVGTSFRTAMQAAWDYLRLRYQLEADRANSDLCRGCLLCHDPDARIR